MTAAAQALHTPICNQFGITYPIFGFAHSVDVVVEVCLAGGLGVFGATRNTPEEIEDALAEIRRRVGNRPFGVDLVIPQGMPERNNREEIEAQLPAEHRAFVDHLWSKYDVPRDGLPGSRSRFVRSEESARRQVEVVLASDVDVFAIGVGSPQEVVAEAKRRGKRMVSLVGAPKHAEHAKAAGADVLVAQGYDAGAHTGQIGTFSLVPQIVAIADGRPVLAAGGVATGQHIAAALALGAQGVGVGTAWLLTKESRVDPIAKRQLARAQGTDTVITRSDSGKTLRVVRSKWTDEWEAAGAPVPLKMPYQDILVGDLLGAISRHAVEPLLHHPAGQGVGWFDRESTVAEVMQGLVGGAATTLERLRA
jgi:NAD(P)H-dependent flavin oxidoreductase YrpB (nitropropane dioxygenase family)